MSDRLEDNLSNEKIVELKIFNPEKLDAKPEDRIIVSYKSRMEFLREANRISMEDYGKVDKFFANLITTLCYSFTYPATFLFLKYDSKEKGYVFK